MSTATTIIPRSYKTYQWSTGQTRSWPQPQGTWLPAGHWVDPTTEAGFPWAQGGGIQTAFSIYPRPDTETNGYARHRVWYYDGTTQFKNIIPIIARGGAFPYNFEIISAPPNAGASMGAASWDTSWRTPLDAIMAGYGDLWVEPTGACTPADGPLWVRAYGQDGLFTDFIFTGTTIAGYYFDSATPADSYGFVFLDPVNGTDPTAYPSATGTTNNISTPIKTMNWAYGSTAGDVTYPNAILVGRSGNIPAAAPDATYGIHVTVNASPMAFIAFPGETVTETLGTAGTRCAWTIDSAADDVFFQGFAMTGGPEASNSFSQFFSSTLHYRFTAHDIYLPYAFAGRFPTSNGNCGPFDFEDPTSESPVVRQYIALKGIRENNSRFYVNNTYSFSILTAYKTQYLCVDLCASLNFGASGMIIKASNSDVTVRGCMMTNAPTGSYGIDFFDQWNAAPSNNREICFNTVFAIGGDAEVVQINGSESAISPNNPFPAGSQIYGLTYSFRNSYVNFPFDVNDPNTPVANGPVISFADAIQYGSATQAIYITRAAGTLPSNVINNGTECQASSGIFNDPGAGDYTFTSAYSQYNGTRGAIIA